MRAVEAVPERTKAVVPPGPGQVDAARRHRFLRREPAFTEEESLRLPGAVGGGGGIANPAHVIEGADSTPVEDRLAAAENKVYRPLDEAALKALGAGLVPPQVLWQEAVVAFDQVRRQRRNSKPRS